MQRVVTKLILYCKITSINDWYFYDSFVKIKRNLELKCFKRIYPLSWLIVLSILQTQILPRFFLKKQANSPNKKRKFSKTSLFKIADKQSVHNSQGHVRGQHHDQTLAMPHGFIADFKQLRVRNTTKSSATVASRSRRLRAGPNIHSTHVRTFTRRPRVFSL